ncbi:MAG: pseudouridine synthase [Tepidisphaeraceae bacterium]
MKERIQKVLAAAGVASRRHVEEMIREGRVAVNGQVLIELPILINPAVDRVSVDDEPVRLHDRPQRGGGLVYIIMNKPRGVYCTNEAQGEQTRAIDLLPPGFRRRVYPVGRLDSESEGLILLTNDGALTNRLTHPRFGVAKTYRAVVDGHVHGGTLSRLKEGIWLADPHKGVGFKSGRSHIKIVKRTKHRSTLDITTREGRNREVRRVLAKVGHKVRELTRVRFGPLSLGNLKPGQSRLLLPRELHALRDSIKSGPPGHGGKPREIRHPNVEVQRKPED